MVKNYFHQKKPGRPVGSKTVKRNGAQGILRGMKVNKKLPKPVVAPSAAAP